VTTYFDSSVILARLLNEQRSEEAAQYFSDADFPVSSWLAYVETMGAIAKQPHSEIIDSVKKGAEIGFDSMTLLNPDEEQWKLAARIAEITQIKSLDALHLAAARYLGDDNLVFATFDRKQAEAARFIGLTVVGA
jgi:predicted nucleic acid-binding protein